RIQSNGALQKALQSQAKRSTWPPSLMLGPHCLNRSGPGYWRWCARREADGRQTPLDLVRIVPHIKLDNLRCRRKDRQYLKLNVIRMRGGSDGSEYRTQGWPRRGQFVPESLALLALGRKQARAYEAPPLTSHRRRRPPPAICR